MERDNYNALAADLETVNANPTEEPDPTDGNDTETDGNDTETDGNGTETDGNDTETEETEETDKNKGEK